MHGHKPKFVLFFCLVCFFFCFVLFCFFFFAIARSEFASCSFPVLFLAPFTLATFCVSYFFSGCRKKLGVNYGQSLEMGPCLHQNCYIVFQFATSERRRSSLALLSNCQEYLVTS